MRNLLLSNPSFRYLEKSFEEWLDVQGYAPGTVYQLPAHVRELLHYFEQQGLKSIREVKARHIEAYYHQLRERANHRRGGGLSNSHLNKHIQAIRKFTEYLRKVGRLEMPTPTLGNESTESNIDYLTVEEIRMLFNTTHQWPEHKVSMSMEQVEAMQARDRAMLAVYYGCGLRRNEGVNLDVGDILFDQSLLHVRKGKNLKERMVPISKTNRQYLTEYVYDHRPELSHGSKEPALFLSYKRPKRLGGQSLALRLKYLLYHTQGIQR